MTYHDLVAKVKSVFEKTDAHEITEHVAVQINVEGEAEGIFYLEVADGSVKVEPYDYHDRDLLITTSAATLIEIAEGRITGTEAAEGGRLRAEGNFEKAGLLRAIDIQKAEPEEEAVVESAEKTEEPTTAEEVKEEEPVTESVETAEEVKEEGPVTESAETVEEVKEEEPVAESTETAEEVKEEKADEPPKVEQTAKTPGGRQISKKKRKKWKKKKTC